MSIALSVFKTKIKQGSRHYIFRRMRIESSASHGQLILVRTYQHDVTLGVRVSLLITDSFIYRRGECQIASPNVYKDPLTWSYDMPITMTKHQSMTATAIVYRPVRTRKEMTRVGSVGVLYCLIDVSAMLPSSGYKNKYR